MSTTVRKDLASLLKSRTTKDKDLTTRIKGRSTNEIVIALCGAAGCGIAEVSREITDQFKSYGYEVKHIKISDIIIEYFNINQLPPAHASKDLKSLKGADRYNTLQDLGNQIRKDLDSTALAVQAIKQISVERELQMSESENLIPPRTVYIINQLKNPAEVDFFRLVYKNIFYLVGILSDQEARLRQLENDDLSIVDAHKLIERDRYENINYGQRLEKTVQQADFFIRNNLTDGTNLEDPCARFVGLVHGKNGITPTKDESGMYAAFSASLNSACLSRQVGAAIADKSGTIISLGWNDVPRFGGGLYSADDKPDHRCVYSGKKCSNDVYKNKLVDSITDLINDEVKLSKSQIEKISKLIHEETRAGSIIEYSRAIHAEMEAILNIARSQRCITEGATLYTTTFPCHNCARHIIAAGIDRVLYIQPYDKSLAMKLHSDAITTNRNDKQKTFFETFEGVAPSRYSSFFTANLPRKDANGFATDIINKNANHISVEYIDSYLDVELKVVVQANKQLPSTP